MPITEIFSNSDIFYYENVSYLSYHKQECLGYFLQDNRHYISTLQSEVQYINFCPTVLLPLANDRFHHNESSVTDDYDEKRLMHDLLRNYERSVRPVFNASTFVVVAIGLTLSHIYKIDEKNQVLSLKIWLEHQWKEERFRWDPKDYNGIVEFTVPTRFLWTPDIVLYNNAEDFQEILQTNVAIHSNSKMLWVPPVNIRSICPLDVTFFPFDDQVCELRFGSWIYDKNQMTVTNRSARINMDSYMDNGEWQVANTFIVLRENQYACCNATTFPEVTFVLHLQRRALFYTYNIIVPCIMLSSLTMMQFWLPCASGEKISLGLTVVLAYSVFNFNIGESMPETSSCVPLIAIYMVSVQGISSLSVLFSVIVLTIHHYGENNQIKVPGWLKFLAGRLLGPLVCIKRTDQTLVERWLSYQISFSKFFAVVVKYLSYCNRTDSCLRNRGTGDIDSYNNVDDDDEVVESSQGPVWKRCADVDEQMRLRNEIDRRQRKREADLQQLLRRAAAVVEKFERQKRIQMVNMEWMEVARVFDRFFFAIILVLTSLITVMLVFVAENFSYTYALNNWRGKHASLSLRAI